MVSDPFSSRARRRSAALVVSAALSALALGGCGGGGRTGSSATSRSQTGGRSPTASASTTTTSTSAALPGTGRPAVTIGDKNYSEQFVLGQLWLQALTAQGYKVSLNENIGPPGVVREALKNGSLAMYPEYLDVFDQTVAGYRRGFHTRRSAYAAAQLYAQRNGLQLLAPTPFSDTSGVAVTLTYATTHHLRDLRDLDRLNGAFTIGGAAGFQASQPGLPTLASVYGVTPHAFHAIAVGSQYGELDSDTIQAAFVNTTDGELASGDYRVLGDPRHVFGFGNVVPVVSAAVLAKEGPAFAATIERVDRTLTLSTIRLLDDAADATGANPATIATAYLQTHGLLPPSSPAAG
jgi:osmoprotectant transport system substrate-binding protein